MFVGVLLSTALLSLFISILYAKYTSRRPQTICRGGYCISLSNDANSINVDNKNDTLSLDGLQTQNNNSLSNHLKLQTKEKRARRMSDKKRKRKSSKSSFSRVEQAARESVGDESLLSSIADEVKDILRSAGALGGMVMKSTLKSAVGLVSNKQVSLSQIVGKWRLYQEIRLHGGNTLSYPVAIELLSDGTVISSFNDEEFSSKFEFKERPWPKKCRISFSIPTANFDSKTSSDSSGSGESSIRPPNAVLHYKGSFKVSLLNRKVVLMRGSVYKSTKKLFNWKTKQKCGRFKGTKRRYS